LKIAFMTARQIQFHPHRPGAHAAPAGVRQRGKTTLPGTLSGRVICAGFRRWKAANVRPLLSLFPDRVQFVRDAAAAQADPGAGAAIG
jgi:hypothetical protein